MSDHRHHRFDEALRDWAGAEPRTPAGQAAQQVMARLPEPRSQRWHTSSWLPLASAAAGLALMLVVGWALLPGTEVPSTPVPSAAEIALPPLQENVVLLWLDDQTPLYLTVAPPATQGGS